MLTGHEALVRALTAARIRRIWCASAERTAAVLEASAAGPTCQRATSDGVAATLALGGALLSGHGTAVLVRQDRLAGLLELLRTCGRLNELRSACLVLAADEGEGDTEGTARSSAQPSCLQLEAATADEVYAVTRLGAQVAQRLGMPVLLRFGEEALAGRTELHEAPPDLPSDAASRFSRAAGPIVLTAAASRYHADKRERRLARLATLAPVFKAGARATPEAWRAGAQAVAALATALTEDDGEPWPLFLARTRGRLPPFVDGDGRGAWLRRLRQGEPPVIVTATPSAGEPGLRDRLVDVVAPVGAAAALAGALAAASSVDEAGGAPRAVAWLEDDEYYAAEALGVLDNVVARRDVLHVIVAARADDERGRRRLRPPAGTLAAQLRGAGAHVDMVAVDDGRVEDAFAAAATREGPRVLLCYGGARQEAT